MDVMTFQEQAYTYLKDAYFQVTWVILQITEKEITNHQNYVIVLLNYFYSKPFEEI